MTLIKLSWRLAPGCRGLAANYWELGKKALAARVPKWPPFYCFGTPQEPMAWRHVTSRENALYQNPDWLFYLIMDKAGIPSTNQNSEQMYVSDTWGGKTPTSNSRLLLFEVLLLIGRLIGQSQSIVKQCQTLAASGNLWKPFCNYDKKDFLL